jgi:hypothetical protein
MNIGMIFATEASSIFLIIQNEQRLMLLPYELRKLVYLKYVNITVP